MTWFHYKLGFQTTIKPRSPNNYDEGFVISGPFNYRWLYGAVFVTNAKFFDARTAKEYLCLTYSPRFRYIINPPINNIIPQHIGEKDKTLISQRTCPAFGKHGGAGEWIIPITDISKDNIPLYTDYFYPEGGNADRWYMAAWDRQLITNVLPSILKGFTGRNFTDKTLKDAQKKRVKINDLESVSTIKSFWDEDIISIMIVKPGGIIVYSPIQVTKTNKYQLLAYLAISCGYSVLQNNVYLKLWGALWEDYIYFDSLSKPDTSNCDIIKNNLKTKMGGEHPSCLYHDMMSQYAKTIANYDACGIRLCAYFLETGDMVFPLSKNDNTIPNKLTLTLSELVIQFKESLLTTYKKPNLSWCNIPKTVVLIPKLGINVDV